MDKQKFAAQLLEMLQEFLQLREEYRRPLAKKMAVFFQKNHKFKNGQDAFTDPDFQKVCFLDELKEYSKYTFPAEDFLLAKKALEKIAATK